MPGHSGNITRAKLLFPPHHRAVGPQGGWSCHSARAPQAVDLCEEDKGGAGSAVSLGRAGFFLFPLLLRIIFKAGNRSQGSRQGAVHPGAYSPLQRTWN